MIKFVSDTTSKTKFVSVATLNDSLSVIQLSMTFVSDTTLNDSLLVIQLEMTQVCQCYNF